MITEVLLILPLNLILFFIWWQFRHLIKIMADVGDILNDNEFLVMLLIHQMKALSRRIKARRIKGCHRQGQGTFIRA